MLQRFRSVTHVVLEKILVIVSVGLIGVFNLPSALAGPVDTPSGEVLTVAKQLVKEMIDNPRGPYSRIVWYCKDGSIQPPKAYACQQHGGGIQHAEYSAKRTQLAELGWSVGTIFAPLKFDQLKNQKPRAQRLRELALEKYLIDIDGGWVLQKAKDYRGRAQLEDETASGKQILLDALSNTEWTRDNYLLVRELVRVIPHDEDSDLSRNIRRGATELAERASSAEKLRAEIHSSPSKNSATQVRAWASKAPKSVAADVLLLANTLASDLDLLYGEKGRTDRLKSQLNKLNKPASKAWQSEVTQLLSNDASTKIAGICRANKVVRESLLEKASVAERLILMDTLGALETEVKLAFLASQQSIYSSRQSIMNVTGNLLDCVYGAGLISATEHKSASKQLLVSKPSVADYIGAVAQLKRIPGWAASTVRFTFAESLVSYSALDQRAARFADDLLRGSPLWLLGDVLKVLSQDVALLSGNEVLLAEQTVASAIALNPGMARGPLRIFETLDAAENAHFAPGDIVVLPETLAELKPVAGILTLGEGNALSHVQLLARNFGIPNVAVDVSTVDLLKPLEGREVVLVVSTEGNVVLRLAEKVKSLEQLFPNKSMRAAVDKISVPPANLSQPRILSLNEIGRAMSGKVIGPKAANLGELNRLFPGRVAPALAVPFGIYQSHLVDAQISTRIIQAYQQHAAGVIDDTQLNIELAAVQAAISALKLSPKLQSELHQTMQAEFGEAGSYGVFIRSDTNVEDLPQFTGAGLSETLANITGTAQIFAGVPRVWASVLSPRAIAWRSSLLTNPEQIYASVLIMKSVPSEKSGVLVTGNLADLAKPGLTVSTAWGVGGAVSGEAAEGLVITPDNKISLISEAKTPYQRELNSKGGLNWVPAAAGQVLTPSDITQLQALAAEVAQKYAPVFDEFGKQRPWDIEFGFVGGKLTLFQIRPLVEKSALLANSSFKQLRPELKSSSDFKSAIDLAASPLQPAP